MHTYTQKRDTHLNLGPFPFLQILSSCPAFCQVRGHMHPWLWLTILDCTHCSLFFSCFLIFLWFRASSLWLWNELHTERHALCYTLTHLKTKNNRNYYKPQKTPQTNKKPSPNNCSVLPSPRISLTSSVQGLNIFIDLQHIQDINQNILLSLSIKHHEWHKTVGSEGGGGSYDFSPLPELKLFIWMMTFS